MSSQAAQPSLVLTRRLADGTVEWIPLEIPARVPAAPEAAYALIDRADYEAPQTMVVQRQGVDLVVEVQGTEALVLDGFFAVAGAAFYPTPDIAGGAGPFSGSPLTPESQVPAGPPAGEQVASSADDGDSDEEEVAPVDTSSAGGTSPMVWVGVGAGGLALAALAGGGGGGSSGDSSTGGGTGSSDTVAPDITSGATAAAIDENSGSGQVIYTATATDASAVTYSLQAGGDAAAFSINASTGAVTLTGNPNFETQSSYSFTVVATDAASNSTAQAVSLAINNLDEVAPSITSGATATAIDENSGAGQVVYTATSTDSGDISAGSTTYSLRPVNDAAAFSINASTGAVTLTDNPDFETKSSYSFTVVATDAAGNSSAQAVSLSIEDRDDSAPFITSGATAAPIDENSGSGQVIYTAAATDDGSVTWSLGAGGDAAALNIDASTGAVTLTGDPDFEAQASYSFTVVATDDEGNSSQQPVSLTINNLDEVAPSITSGGTATAIDENSGAGQVVYTATSTDSGDISTGSTIYSLQAGGDAAAFSINANTGAVTLTGNPNFEAKSTYSFTVVATDAAGNSSQQLVSLGINNLDEVAPTITSGATATAIDENSGAGQVVYTATSTDSGDISTGSTAYSLQAGGDAAAFSINASTGAVTLTGNPNFEAKSAYSFTVVATDAAGNSSQRAVSLAINNLDEVAPTITSGATATAIDENSGAGQVVYTTTSTDNGDISTGSTIYSLRPVNDFAAFSINASTGAVTLTGDPDFETDPSYSFTVLATDTAGNSSEQAVSLAINDIVDETGPTVTDVALTSAIGAQNDTLNAGDTARVTVTMSENTVVDTTGGTPRIELNVGGSTVFAGYVSGSGTTSLNFDYIVQPGDTDSNGISIQSDSLELNGGTLADTAGNAADLDHGSVGNDASFIVDTAAPTLSSSTPDDEDTGFQVNDDIVLSFSEDVQAGTGNIVISDGSDTRTIDITDGSQVSISGNDVTIDPATDLNANSTYNVQIASGVITDQAGNAYAGISDSGTLNFDTEIVADTSIVVFDLIQDSSSDHSGRSFQSGVSYDIYIRVDSNDASLSLRRRRQVGWRQQSWQRRQSHPRR